MNLNQTYETTVYDSQRKWAIRVMVLPSRTFIDGKTPIDYGFLKKLVGFGGFKRIEGAVELPSVIAALVAHDVGANEDFFVLRDARFIEANLLKFTETISFTEIIPFESSPLSLRSLASIIVKAPNPVGIGFVTALISVGIDHPHPLLLIAVPAGIIICGGAITFGKWFDERRDEILRTLFRLEAEPATPKIAAKSASAPKKQSAKRATMKKPVEKTLPEHSNEPKISPHKIREQLKAKSGVVLVNRKPNRIQISGG